MKIKVILFCLLNNLIGVMLNKFEFEEIVVIVEKYNLIVLFDEIYVEFVYDEVYISFVSIKNMCEYMILILGFLKGFVMIGWCFGMIVVFV